MHIIPVCARSSGLSDPPYVYIWSWRWQQASIPKLRLGHARFPPRPDFDSHDPAAGISAFNLAAKIAGNRRMAGKEKIQVGLRYFSLRYLFLVFHPISITWCSLFASMGSSEMTSAGGQPAVKPVTVLPLITRALRSEIYIERETEKWHLQVKLVTVLPLQELYV